MTEDDLNDYTMACVEEFIADKVTPVIQDNVDIYFYLTTTLSSLNLVGFSVTLIRKTDNESQTLNCSLNIKTGTIRVGYGTYNQSFDYTCVKNGSYENYIKCMEVKFDDEDTFVI